MTETVQASSTEATPEPSSHQAEPNVIPSKMLRFPEVQSLLGVSRTTLWRKVREGAFPAPVKINQAGNCVAWFAHEIHDWQQNLPRARPPTNR